MNRFGIFVDAGYLYAASGTLLYGHGDRRELIMDFQGVTEALRVLAATRCGSEHLRTYWYDGARDLVPTAQQVEVANLPGVKLRLGRLTASGQKGVDSRIVRDLITLSIERAISHAFLLGGDEDLREGVSEAQERGVRVVLIGVEPLNEQNLSPTLAMEADDVLLLDRAFVEPHFRRREADVIPAVEPADPTDPVALARAFAIAHLESRGGGRESQVIGSSASHDPTGDRPLAPCLRFQVARCHSRRGRVPTPAAPSVLGDSRRSIAVAPQVRSRCWFLDHPAAILGSNVGARISRNRSLRRPERPTETYRRHRRWLRR